MQYELDPTQAPTLEQESQAPIEMDAQAHWERFLPKTCADLRRRGPTALPMAVRKAYLLMEFQIAQAMAESPELPREMADQLFRETLYPPPEPRTRRASSRPTTH